MYHYIVASFQPPVCVALLECPNFTCFDIQPPHTRYPMYLRPGAVQNETGAVVLVPSWLKTDTVTLYSIPGTVSTMCSVALPSSWYCWAIVSLENCTVSVRDSALSSGCWWVRDHVTWTWELVMFDTLTFEGRAGGTVCCVWRDREKEREEIKKCCGQAIENVL